MKIQSLHLKNFKCLENVKFEFGNLNLLAGANGCGKSSLIQSLLLLRQSYEKTGNADTLLTSGNYINLGAANDILYDNADKNEDISGQKRLTNPGCDSILPTIRNHTI